jgi:hypothetical protein
MTEQRLSGICERCRACLNARALVLGAFVAKCALPHLVEAVA